MTTARASSSVLNQFVERARSLYSLPAVALRVLELTNSPKVDVRALKDCIENDPALTMKILRVVNSSLFGLTREVTDLNQALALLGTKPLKMLVLGFSLPKNLFTALEADVLSRYWRHTLTKAVVARELTQRLWRVPGDEAFIAGLLQEIGQLVLIQDLGDPYVRFANRVYTSGGDLLQLELETLGFDHAVLSARLLDHWHLPTPIVQAVGMPHDAAAILALPPGEQMLPQALHLAELITRLLMNEGNHLLNLLVEVGRAYRRLMVDDLPLLLDDLDAKVQQLAEVLQLQIADAHDYRTVLADAHTQLSQVAEEVARELSEASQVWLETSALSQAVSDFTHAPALPRTAPREAETCTPSKLPPLRSSPLEPTTTATVRRAVSPARAAGWSDPGLDGRLVAAVTNCRQARRPLSLALLEVDNFDSWVMRLGREGTTQLMRRLSAMIAAALAGEGTVVHLGDGQFAVVFEAHDRPQSVETVREVLASVRPWSQEHAEEWGQALCLSVGLASLGIPPKNFPTHELIGAAQRCLQGAQLSGGDSLKSIEMV